MMPPPTGDRGQVRITGGSITSMATRIAAHSGPWTEHDLLALPHDGQRHELVEGSLLASPLPAGLHQQTVLRLAGLLLAATPRGLDTVEGLGVRVPGGSVLVPDILVADMDAISAAGSGILEADAVRLVVEIVSPGSVSMDRINQAGPVRAGRHPRFLAGGAA